MAEPTEDLNLWLSSSHFGTYRTSCALICVRLENENQIAQFLMSVSSRPDLVLTPDETDDDGGLLLISFDVDQMRLLSNLKQLRWMLRMSAQW